MTWTTIRENTTIEYPSLTITGDILYDPAQCALVHSDPLEGDEWLSTDLLTAGFIPEPGQCFIKDWAEHSGFAQALATAGLIEIIEPVTTGPFNTQAYRVRVITQR